MVRQGERARHAGSAQFAGSPCRPLLFAANYTKGLTELFAFMALLATVATLVLYLFAGISALRLMALGELRRGAAADRHAGRHSLRFVDLLWGGRGGDAVGSVLLMTGIPVWFGMRLSSLWSSPAPEAAPAAPPEIKRFPP